VYVAIVRILRLIASLAVNLAGILFWDRDWRHLPLHLTFRVEGKKVVKLFTRLAASALILGTLVVTAHAQLYWDVDTISSAGAGGGTTPSGTWDTGITPNWNVNSNGTGIPGIWTDGSDAIFSAGSSATGTYTVTLGGTVGANSVTFKDGNATISGGTELDLTGTGTITTLTGATGTISSALNTSATSPIIDGAGNLTISGPLSGFNTLTKNGTGTATLSTSDNTATFFGGIQVNQGILSVSNAGSLGDTFGTTTVASGASLQVSGGITIPEQIIIDGTGSSSNGALRKTGNNTTTLTGGVTVNSPSRIQSDATTTGTLVFNNQPINFGANDLTFSVATETTGLGIQLVGANRIVGSGNIIKEGGGVLNLGVQNTTPTANNGTFSGKWIINGGTVRMNAAANSGVENGSGCNCALGAVTTGVFVPDAITLNGGTLSNNTNGGAGNFIRNERGIKLGPNGGSLDVAQSLNGASPAGAMILIYTSGDVASATNGSSVAGTGGRITMNADAVTAGGATLTKTGGGELRVQGTGTQFYDFTKLKVQGGLYRIGSVTFGTPAVQQSSVNGFGVTPASPMADQITLDGGDIGTSFAATLTANRGLTVTPNGGGFQGSLTIQGPIVSAVPGQGTLRNTSGSNTLSGNNAGFSGNLAANAGTLTLSSNITVQDFSGTANGTSAADVSIGSAAKLTIGSGTTTNTTFRGRLLGAGKFRKTGNNTVTFDMAGTGNLLNMSGTAADTFVVDGGGITLSNAGGGTTGFNALVAGTLSLQVNTGTLDMSPVTGSPTFAVGSLNSTASAGTVTLGNNGLTLGQTANTARSYTGTITSTGGALTMASTAAYTQTLGGANTLAAVNVNGGRLNFSSAASTTGAVTVAGPGILGGSGGSVSGAVTVQSGGTLAPGASIGTLGTGALSMLSGSTFQYELNTSGTPAADLLNVNGALSLGGATLFTDDLNASPITLAGGSKFTLMSYAGAWDSSTFAGINNGDTVTVDGIGYKIKYDDTAAGSLNAGSLYTSAVTLSIPGAAGLLGDFNNDGKVDAADYITWRKNGVANASLPNDSGLGTQAARYSLWKTNFGRPSPGAGSGGGLNGSSAVPEPSSIALLMVALAAMVTRRRGR
jgi:fibronectin-binding autotransporter adhesin